MLIAKVVGNVVATKKDERLTGKKLLILRPFRGSSFSPDETLVAVDCVGAGIGETVLTVCGSSARIASDGLESPIDAAVVGIVDTMETGN
jgi:ethanolamine utilization protein EutN